jgi:hypothetical protein
MLSGDVLRQIGVATGGEPYRFQQDLASARAAKTTKLFFERENAMLAPWMQSGADLAPLDVFVNGAAKSKVRGRDISSPK